MAIHSVWVTQDAQLESVLRQVRVTIQAALPADLVARVSPERLESALQPWVQAALQTAHANPAPCPASARPTVRAEQWQASLRFFPAPEGGGVIVIHVEADPSRPTCLMRRGLSAREAAILHLVAQGHSDTEVGAQLGISTRTVNNNLHRIYTRIGVANRAGVVAWVYRQDRWSGSLQGVSLQGQSKLAELRNRQG